MVSVEVLAVVLGLMIIASAVWVWRWNPKPESGLAWFPVAHVPGYSKALALILAVLGVVWLGFVLRALL